MKQEADLEIEEQKTIASLTTAVSLPSSCLLAGNKEAGQAGVRGESREVLPRGDIQEAGLPQSLLRKEQVVLLETH